MSFAIVTDTSANIPTPLAQEHQICVIPLSYIIDGEQRECTNTETFDSDSYYDAMKAGVKITTSQINPQKDVDAMEGILQQGQDVLFVGMSAGISGTFHSAQIAKDMLLETYPERKICLVDSMGASLGEGVLVLKAIEYRQQGKTLEETEQLLNEERWHIAQIFTVADLNHLRRGGRLSNAAAIVGTLLGIKPVLKGNEEGKIVSTEKVRGRKAVINRLAQKYEQLVEHPENQTVCISHCSCPEDAKMLETLIREKGEPKEILIVSHEPVTGSYLGPGALALYFEGGRDIRTK